MEITTKPLLAAVQLIPPIPGHAAHTERTAVADHTTAAAKSASNQAPHKKDGGRLDTAESGRQGHFTPATHSVKGKGLVYIYTPLSEL